MGYTQDTHMSQFIPVSAFKFAGTCVLTHAVGSHLVQSDRGLSTTAFSIWIPIPLPSNSSALKGSLLQSIDLYFVSGTSSLTSFAAPVVQKTTLPAADASAPTGSEVTSTYLPVNGTCVSAAQHKVTVTLTTPEWMDDAAAYFLDIEIDPAADTTISFYGARANYVFRV